MKKRQVVQRFTNLLGLDALHEANVRDNPLPYLECASERIYQLEKALYEAAEAATATPVSGEPSQVQSIELDMAEYQRLVRCRSIVEKASSELISGEYDV